jgi:hypothetical protein
VRTLALALLVAPGAAMALDTGADAALCAAFWYGAADFRAGYLALNEAPDMARELAARFRDLALRLEGSADAVDRAIARDRPGMELMNRGYAFAADVETIRLWDRTARRCETLLPG